jgi:hypothetical protein
LALITAPICIDEETRIDETDFSRVILADPAYASVKARALKPSILKIRLCESVGFAGRKKRPIYRTAAP